jgi:hypothetical protein
MLGDAPTDNEDDDMTYDETKWMAVAIELLVVLAAIVFAVVQSW